MLGRKQDLTVDTWQAALDRIDEVVPPSHLDARLEDAVRRVRGRAAREHVAYGWSGGKDSIALEYVMRQAGVDECFLVVTDLEYPAFTAWVADHAPPHLEIVNTGQDYDWLAARPHMLFPQGRYGPAWFKAVQHTGQRRYTKAHKVDTLAIGRRRKDGNYTGPKGADEYTDRHGVTRWSPLADWTHEETIALIKRSRLELPPIYDTPRGFIVGTGPWPARQGCSTDPADPTYGWREMWQIAPEVVAESAERGLPGAADYMQEVTNGR